MFKNAKIVRLQQVFDREWNLMPATEPWYLKVRLPEQ